MSGFFIFCGTHIDGRFIDETHVAPFPSIQQRRTWLQANVCSLFHESLFFGRAVQKMRVAGEVASSRRSKSPNHKHYPFPDRQYVQHLPGTDIIIYFYPGRTDRPRFHICFFFFFLAEKLPKIPMPWMNPKERRGKPFSTQSPTDRPTKGSGKEKKGAIWNQRNK